MLYGLGKPGQRVRQFVDAGVADMRYQVRDGETAIPADSCAPAMISIDGTTLKVAAVAEDPAAVEALLLASIDAAAAEERRRWLTVAPGQADEYRETWAEVQDFRSLGATLAQILLALAQMSATAQRARFPFLFAEADASGISLSEAATRIEAARQISRESRALIKRKRRSAKIAVKAATSIVAKKAAAKVNWSA
ncbi:hypothetical protein [Sphingomonas solaris]|uniref:Uncharacterized protein n=1 Tax=Alterirhizorhabdus solaris TaxID=2529389 RepID=A0A558R817_9SPHN|nr:hypothetical protein [Sphingomonas solaris]TVV75543.1 hypothetical protein FOY91_06685 [Sphingomonas solaris]